MRDTCWTQLIYSLCYSWQSCSMAVAGPGPLHAQLVAAGPRQRPLNLPSTGFGLVCTVHDCHSQSSGRYKANPTCESCFCWTRRINANLPNLSNRFVVVLNLALDNLHSWSATDNMTTNASLLASIILPVWGFYGERSSTATGAVSEVRGHSCNDQHS